MTAGRKQVEHEVRQVLDLLSREGAHLKRRHDDPETSSVEGAPFDILRGAAAGKIKRMGCVEGGLVKQLIMEGLVHMRAGLLQINGAGRAYLRRAQEDQDPFRSQHCEFSDKVIRDDALSRSVRVNTSESPLSRLLNRRGKDGKRLLSQIQFDAGERLREDFWFAQMTPRVTANWSGSAPEKSQRRSTPSGSDMSDHVIAAKGRVDAALRAVGPELSGVLIDMCCYLKGLEETEKSRGWPQRSGKVVLLLALDCLARHYGLLRDEGARGHAKIEGWGVADFKPNIDAWR